MSSTNLPPKDKKATRCQDCGKWVTLQGYGGRRRFHHGEYQRNLKRQLFNRLIALRLANKVSKDVHQAMACTAGEYSKSTLDEILAVRDFTDSIP